VAAVRVIFTRRRHPGSLLLRVALWSAWSHCAIIDGDQVIEAAATGGVRVRPLADLIADSSEHDIRHLPARDAASVIAAARSQVGKPYDWAGVVGIGFRRRWQDADSWFCSELIAWAFQAAGSPLFRVQSWRITPRDLFISMF
jgi:uncharacterized protein YycO